jgi:hypothetical protein
MKIQAKDDFWNRGMDRFLPDRIISRSSHDKMKGARHFVITKKKLYVL